MNFDDYLFAYGTTVISTITGKLVQIIQLKSLAHKFLENCYSYTFNTEDGVWSNDCFLTSHLGPVH